MVIDTSALVAILLQEPEARSFAEAIQGDSRRLLGAANLFETAIVIEVRRGEHGVAALDLLVHTAGIEVVPLTKDHVAFARHAWRQFGKGRHPAALNFGDCLAYALARATGEPLLCQGADFARTDVPRVEL